MTYTLATSLVLMFVTAALAIYYWRRSAGLYSLLVEGANRFEEMRQRSTSLEQATEKAETRYQQHRETQARLERAVAEARDKTAELTRRVETKEHEARFIAEKLELQKGHLEKQLAKAEGKVVALEAARATLAAEVTELRQALAASTEELALRERDFKSREKEREAAAARHQDADPVELKRLKRKITQYDRLYASMKGLREMTEERNRNWEVALRKLSAWIIKEQGGPAVDADTRDIGPLVGQALGIVGAQLIDDQYQDADLQTAAFGAALADSMDADEEAP